MSAFDGSRGQGAGVGPDMDDILAQMFGMGGGMPSGFGGARGPQKPRKGADEEHPYQVTLEDLYKGKTTKFASTKDIICSLCRGSGGKEKAKAKQCASCQGRGTCGYLNTGVLTRLMGCHRLQRRFTGRRARNGHSRNNHLQLL